MHIVLLILKIIGIFLLVILGLLLLIVLALLLIPFRYRGAGQYKSPETLAEVSVGWLLRLVSLDARYEPGTGFSGELRVLRFIIKSFGNQEIRKQRDTAKKAVEDKKAEQKEIVASAVPQKSGKDATQPRPSARQDEDTDYAVEKPDPGNTETSTGEKKPGPKKTKTFKRKKKPDPEKTEPSAGKTPAGKEASSAGETSSADSERWEELLGTLICTLAGVPEKAADLTILLLDLKDRLEETIEKPQEKIREMQRKAAPFLDASAIRAYRFICRRLAILFRHCRIRQITGYAHYGTGRPDLTGEITGILYMLLPDCAGEFRIEPEMFETVLEGEISFRGYLRTVHVVVLLAALLLNKDTRKLIGKIRRARGGR